MVTTEAIGRVRAVNNTLFIRACDVFPKRRSKLSSPRPSRISSSPVKPSRTVSPLSKLALGKTLSKHASPNQHSCRRECPRYNWHCLLVYPVGTADMAQLETEKYRWPARFDDVHMGFMYGSIISFAPHFLTSVTAALPLGVYTVVQVLPPLRE